MISITVLRINIEFIFILFVDLYSIIMDDSAIEMFNDQKQFEDIVKTNIYLFYFFFGNIAKFLLIKLTLQFNQIHFG